MVRKKSKFRRINIGKKRYYFYRITWLDITGDASHASPVEFNQFECAKMVTLAYIYKITKKFVWTFASYDNKDEAYSDRNIFPRGCIIKMEKINV